MSAAARFHTDRMAAFGITERPAAHTDRTATGITERLAALRPHEFLIFAILFTLLALCLAVVPLVATEHSAAANLRNDISLRHVP